MIRPNKHAHPDKTLIAATMCLLKTLKRKRSIAFDDLKNTLLKYDGDLDSLFLPSINLLYMLGLLEYRKKNDTFEYVGD